MKKHYDTSRANSVSVFIALCFGSPCFVTNHPKAQGLKTRELCSPSQLCLWIQVSGASLTQILLCSCNQMNTYDASMLTCLAFQMGWMPQLWTGQMHICACARAHTHTQPQMQTLDRKKIIDTSLSLPKFSQLRFGDLNPFVHPLSWLLLTENRPVKVMSHFHQSGRECFPKPSVPK